METGILVDYWKAVYELSFEERKGNGDTVRLSKEMKFDGGISVGKRQDRFLETTKNLPQDSRDFSSLSRYPR